MTDHLAAIREAAERIAANGREEWMGDKALLLISSRQKAQEILRLLDEAEKDTCIIKSISDGLGGTERRCNRCSFEIDDQDVGNYAFCPGCGRRIVKEEN